MHRTSLRLIRKKDGSSTMKRFDRPFAFLLLAFLLLPTLLPAQQVSLTIFHTNDTHGHLLPFSYPNDVPPGSDLADLTARTNIGGIARRAGLVKKLRAELEKKGTTVWLVDVGDFSDGTPFSTEYHGEADAAAMNASGYTFGALGNHEFNQPIATLKNLISLFKYPILCANAVENSTGKLLTRPSQIQMVGPLKIGIFGLVTAETSDYPAAREGITIAGEIETAQRMVEELQKKADIIVMLSHCGDKFDKRIAEAVPGLDVIVGGHSHSRIPWGNIVYRSEELKAQEVNGTIIVQAYQWGGELGRLDLLFGKDPAGSWHVERHRAVLLPITEKTPEDPAVAAVIARYWDPIAPRYGEIIGKAAADFVERGDDLAQYNLVADAIRESFGTEIELENMGGIRAPLVKGDITRGALIDMDPFDNTIVTFTVNGRTLRKILQSHRPAVSGIRYRMENGSLAKVTVAGKPLQDNRTYTGTTNSYLARIALKGIQIKNTGKQRLDVLIEYVRKKGTVYPTFDGRRVIVGSENRSLR
jgi:5'-nucleotidase / UDP-sugar diphosphatase